MRADDHARSIGSVQSCRRDCLPTRRSVTSDTNTSNPEQSVDQQPIQTQLASAGNSETPGAGYPTSEIYGWIGLRHWQAAPEDLTTGTRCGRIPRAPYTWGSNLLDAEAVLNIWGGSSPRVSSSLGRAAWYPVNRSNSRTRKPRLSATGCGSETADIEDSSSRSRG